MLALNMLAKGNTSVILTAYSLLVGFTRNSPPAVTGFFSPVKSGILD